MLYAKEIFDKEEIGIIKEMMKFFNGKVTMVEVDGEVVFESLDSNRRVSGNSLKSAK